jgi:hypothetical protein
MMANAMESLRDGLVLRVSIAGLAVIGLTACAGGAAPLRTGPEVAVLETMSNARVVGIDGVRVSGRAFTLLPGEHDLWMYIAEPNGRVSKVWSHCRVAFEAKAGERYQSRLRTRPNAATHERRLEPGITDADGVLLAPATSCSRFKPPDLNG